MQGGIIVNIGYDMIMKGDNNPWVVLIHGFGGSGRMFKRQLDGFKKYFNVLTLDLPGHGNSTLGLAQNTMSLKDVTLCILNLLHKLNINKADFIGISLGTIIVTSIAVIEPRIVDKVILGGAVCGVGAPIELLVKMVNIVKGLFPYTLLISIFAHLMMPKHRHKKSRSFMIKESRSLGKAEFKRWYELLVDNISYVRNNIKNLCGYRSIFIMGQDDYIFLHNVAKVSHKYNIELDTIKNCGHVCNIDQYKTFNNIAINFLLGG